MSISDLNQAVAAVTGAGSGIGRALAVALAKRNTHLALADIDGDRLEETAGAVPSGVRVSTHIVDVADRGAVAAFADQVIEEHGQVNLVFNNAGVTVADSTEDILFEDFEWLMGINFWGVVNGCKAFLPYLQQVEEAAIVNTSSIFGTISVPMQSAYNASKFAVRGFTYSLRQELMDTHISVSCVQPGGVKTNIARDSRSLMMSNDKEAHANLAAEFDRIARLQPDQAAEQIIRGVLAGKPQILVGRDAKALALLERLMPTGYHRLLARIRRRFEPEEQIT